MNVLLTWWHAATPEQKKVLAELAGTTVPGLHQTAHAYRSDGKLRVTPEFAARLERASVQIEDLPVLWREDMSPACGQCELIVGCRDDNP